MRSNSGRRRIRCDAARFSAGIAAPPGELTLVRDREPLSPLGAPPLQYDAAIFRRHPHPEAVGLLAAAGVGLVGALALHKVLMSTARVDARGGTVNTSRGSRRVSTKVR